MCKASSVQIVHCLKHLFEKVPAQVLRKITRVHDVSKKLPAKNKLLYDIRHILFCTICFNQLPVCKEAIVFYDILVIAFKSILNFLICKFQLILGVLRIVMIKYFDCKLFALRICSKFDFCAEPST